MIFKGNNSEILEVTELHSLYNEGLQLPSYTELSILWFLEDSQMIIDTKSYTFEKNQVLCITEFNKVEYYHIPSVRHIRFNHSFYCVISQDKEVSCKGILFYGAYHLPIFQLADDILLIQRVWDMFALEMQFYDETQLEMLQMLTKRMLLIFNRIYKEQNALSTIKKENLDLFREFAFLVETHFKQYKSVEQYAELLNKSPKTLSNMFKKAGVLPPMRIIKNRITLEAQRLLKYTNIPISQIGFELGYEDIQSFSRFFKSETGISPTDFRK